ncbi:MAG: trypsin-like peptidase domain-containing protein [Betaproteobacteria bacterium]|nr:trypsin-like peptidase domain-containing protein [Betaproteobacteria bacterium]
MKSIWRCCAAAALWAASLSSMAYVGSRVVTGEDAPPSRFRSDTAPVTEVAIAPTAKQLADKAVEASYGKSSVPVAAKILGIGRTPEPLAPLRVGAIFESGKQAFAPEWETQKHGFVTQARIVSKGAKGIRAKIKLPPGLVLGEILARAPGSDVAEHVPLRFAFEGEIWTPYTDGETQLIEIFSPQLVAGSTWNIVHIGHFERPLNTGGGGEARIDLAAGACSPDVACTSNDPFLDAAIAERRKSVARITFASGGSFFNCSGTLINSNSQQNLFMTANHCVSTQAEAASITFRWFYEAATCGGSAANLVPEAVTQSSGAQLLFSNKFVDSTLLRLNANPPVGAVFAGWNATPLNAGSNVVSISHPAGDVKKFALGTLQSIQNRSDGLIRVSGYEQEMYAVLFNRGVIEGGSSGSGLFTMNGGDLQFRGVLSNSTVRNGGGLSCTNTNENANYGRWDYFQPQIVNFLNGVAAQTDDHANQPGASSTLLTLNGPAVAAKIDYVGDLDTFRIVVTEPGTLYVKSNGGYDLIGHLMDSAGTTLQNANDDEASNDDAGVGSNDFGIAWPVTPGTYFLMVANWVPTTLTPNGYSVEAKFLNATTNHTAIWWGGEQESGWGLNVNHQGNTIFATMFNYENAGSGNQNPNMWLSAVLNRVGTSQQYSGDVKRVYGPAFNANPFPNQQITAPTVGGMTLAFNGANAATLSYTVAGSGTGGNGLPVNKSLTRYAFGTEPVCAFTGTDRSFGTGNFQDVWWNANESGWGIYFVHQSETIFATLFTFEAGTGNNNKGLWLSSAMSRESAGVYSGDLLRVTGSAFNASPFIPLNPAVNATNVGKMRVSFTNGNAATLTYDVNGSAVTKPIERLVFGAFPPECSPP